MRIEHRIGIEHSPITLESPRGMVYHVFEGSPLEVDEFQRLVGFGDYPDPHVEFFTINSDAYLRVYSDHANGEILAELSPDESLAVGLSSVWRLEHVNAHDRVYRSLPYEQWLRRVYRTLGDA